MDLMFGHKASFNKYKKTEITSCILSDQSGIKVESTARESTEIIQTTWRLNNTFLNNQ
jgi:hypothetical protein